MVCKDTLVFKNWRPDLTVDEKQDFLIHFGAKTIKFNGPKVFAKFESENIAKNIMGRLHQIDVLGSYLSVEYSHEEIGCDKIPKNLLEYSNYDKNYTNFLNKLNGWNCSVNFNQPPPPHLKYMYPKANRATINNIAHALATVPKFYTQVLHLMNRMNLPPPFSNIPDPPQRQEEGLISQNRPEICVQTKEPMVLPQNSGESVSAEKSSSESEYESDPDDTFENRPKEVIPEKRQKIQKNVIKKPKFVKPVPNVSTQKPQIMNPEEIFDKVDYQKVQKKIEVKTVENLDRQEDSSNIVTETFGKIPCQKVPENLHEQKDIQSEESVDLISETELSENRISPKDFGLLPVFKDYHPGPPSCRLYIKNLAKNVTLKDLERIYKRYDQTELAESEANMFDIRLMQEGRMKGQAFVTLQNVNLAQEAVKMTNGFILKNKPLVVVFARSAVPKNK